MPPTSPRSSPRSSRSAWPGCAPRPAAATAAGITATAAARARARLADADAAATLGKATDRARATVRASEQDRATRLAARTKLARAYQAELGEIDKLKRQKASWRRDRLLRDRLASSLETAKKLSKASAELTILDARLLQERRALIAAIDAELAAGPAAARTASLQRVRTETARAVAPAVKAKKIVIPDDEIDPLADPDELEAQARALRDSEAELARQIASLDGQVDRFRKQAELRKAHDRAGELAARDDGQPRRTAGSAGSRDGAELTGDAAPQDGGDGPAADPSTSGAGGFEGDPAVVLSDVVDADTVDALRKAERSSDPSAKAAAAERARREVARRLAALRKRRLEIEKRAKDLAE
ncbi:MAG: hypothetical protein H6708_10735 [Kofleriaceae bacterium]|nr:hypothetical protein [Kofleriaceae bacterium]